MRIILFLFVAALCFVFPAHARPQSGYYSDPILEELRIEIDDLKHALKTIQVELNLVDERTKKQDNSLTTFKGDFQNKEKSSLHPLSSQINVLEKKVSSLEKLLEKVTTDLRTLSTTISQTLNKAEHLEHEVSSHGQRLDEVVKLKGTLTSISKAISQKPSYDVDTAKTYRVKAGDSLERIARNHRISIETLRKLNNLSNDKIIVGQELRLPDDSQ